MRILILAAIVVLGVPVVSAAQPIAPDLTSAIDAKQLSGELSPLLATHVMHDGPLQLRNGGRSAARGAAAEKGLLVGFLAGASAGVLFDLLSDGTCSVSGCIKDVVLLGAMGAGIGAAVGSAQSRVRFGPIVSSHTKAGVVQLRF